MGRSWIIDADTHITEPGDVWTSRVPARYVEAMPTLTRDAGGVDVWTLGGRPIYRAGVTAPAGWPAWPLGFRGILFTGEPQRFGCPFLADRHWDPLWSAARDAGLPVHFHIGGGEGESTEMADRMPVQGHPGATAHAAVNLFMKNGIQCADLILSGVLSRYPEVKFVSVESGVGWVPFMLETADYSYLGAFRPGRARTEELLPSELFRRQVYCTYWFEQVAPRTLFDELPIDNVMFETDFPHTACLYGNIAERIDTGLAGVGDEVRHKILWGNVTALYHVEQPAFPTGAAGGR